MLGGDLGTGTGVLNFKRNIAIGGTAMASTGSNEQTGTIAIGYGSLNALTSGARNTAIGYSSGLTLATSSDCVLIGYEAGKDMDSSGSTPQSCTYVGSYAGKYLDDGTLNTAVGHGAMEGTTGGSSSSENAAFGHHSLTAITSGDYNTSIGGDTLKAITTQANNTAVGFKTLENATSDDNTAVGFRAGDALSSGSGCTFIGKDADASANNVTDEIVLKAGTDALVGGGVETIRIGVDSDYIVNDFGENATWSHSSDRRIKKDIKDSDLGLEFINDLRPVTFIKKAPSEYPKEFDQYNPAKTKRKNPDKVNYGFIAQEVKEAMDKSNHSNFPVWKEDADGMQQLGEAELITPLVKAIQELSAKVEDLEKQLKGK